MLLLRYDEFRLVLTLPTELLLAHTDRFFVHLDACNENVLSAAALVLCERLADTPA